MLIAYYIKGGPHSSCYDADWFSAKADWRLGGGPTIPPRAYHRYHYDALYDRSGGRYHYAYALFEPSD